MIIHFLILKTIFEIVLCGVWVIVNNLNRGNNHTHHGMYVSNLSADKVYESGNTILL